VRVPSNKCDSIPVLPTGSMIGSKAMSAVPPLSCPDGTNIQTCLERVEGYIHRSSTPDMAAFVELHVEQGPILESASIGVGIVIKSLTMKSKPRRLNSHVCARCFEVASE